MPIAQAQTLRVGQVLPLSGCTVHSVRMVSADGRDVGAAKLGQSGGMRAIRIETAPPADMMDLTTAGPEPIVPEIILEEAPQMGLAPEPAEPAEMDLASGALGDGLPAPDNAFEDVP